MTVEDVRRVISSAKVFQPAEPPVEPGSTRKPARRLAYTLADDVPDSNEPFDDELIEGVLGRLAMAVIYGDSNSGKTFLAIDIAASICRAQRWMDRPVRRGLVIYLASESPGSVMTRVRAYRRQHQAKLPGFVIVESPVNLFDGTADVAAVVQLVQEMEALHGEKVALIIGDTLARLSAGANENSGEDMGIVVRNCDAIRDRSGATFMLIHHSGKDAAKGARGWSGLRAAIDTEIEVTADEATGIRTAEITKQRDLPGKGTRIGFRLEVVDLGVNTWGTPRGSCVVVPTDAAPKREKGKRLSEIAGAITEFLLARGTGAKSKDIVKHFEGRYQRQSVYRELGKMRLSGALIECASVYALPGKTPVSPTDTNHLQETEGDKVDLSPTVASPFRGGDKGDNPPRKRGATSKSPSPRPAVEAAPT